MISFGSHVFATLTYTRSSSSDICWQNANNHFNRYIQKLRRLHNSNVQYVRCIEAHEDFYPHFHAVLQFPKVLTVSDARYFDRILYQQWKQLWTSGLSDFQHPRSKQKPILYLIKYISKGATLNTLWKKCYPVPSVPVSSSLPLSSCSIPVPNISTDALSPTQQLCKKHKIKQLTWSRGFKFPVLKSS
uniref:Replication-associated protein n=1 Tax=Diporeia sp. associated circular virus TaxID=1299317 RepID=M1S3T7_9VIRU|nr:replication-associated protein [Diporeia sp. associated circular virus]